MCMLSCSSNVPLFATLRTIVSQVPLSMRFSRQEYWSGFLCPPPGDLLDSGIKPTSLMSPALAGGFFTTSTTWEVFCYKLFPLHYHHTVSSWQSWNSYPQLAKEPTETESLSNLASNTKWAPDLGLSCKSSVYSLHCLMSTSLLWFTGSCAFYPALLYAEVSCGGVILCHVDHGFELIIHLKMASNPNIRTHKKQLVQRYITLSLLKTLNY